MIKMILATDINGGLGLNNTLPWHIPEDLEYFKRETLNSSVVMGNNTFKSLPFEKGLPKRSNYVVTSEVEHYKTEYWDYNTALTSCSMDKVKSWLSMWRCCYREHIYIIGGKSIYEQLFPFVEEVHHSKINDSYECDTFIDTSLWENNPDFKIVETIPLCDNVGVNIWRKM